MQRQSQTSAEATAAHLMFISGYVHRLLRHEAKVLKLRWTALMVLKDLQLLGPVSQRTLAEIEQVAAPTMTVLIRQMEQRGWIRRASAAGDARVSLVSITAEGMRELKHAGRLLRRRLEQELTAVPPRVLDALGDDLGQLSTALLKKIQGGG